MQSNGEEWEGEISEIQKEALKHWDEEFGSGQCLTILEDLLDKFEGQVATSNMSPHECRASLFAASSLLTELQDALTFYKKGSYLFDDDDEKKKALLREEEYNKGNLWQPPSQEIFNERPELWDGVSPVDKGSLETAIAGYLKNEAIQHNLIDWCIVNSLIFDETARFVEEVKSGTAFGKINWSYTFADGNILKTALFAIGLRVLGFLFRWVIPVAVIFALYSFGHETVGKYVGGSYALYLLYRLVMIPSQWRAHRNIKKQREKAGEILLAMGAVLEQARSKVASPTRTKELVTKAEDLGAVFSPAIYSLLDRAIQRDPSVFIAS